MSNPTVATTHLCRDVFAGHPQSIVGLAGGHTCDRPVRGLGWMCDEHGDMSRRLLSTPITDIPDDREVRARRTDAAMDPETKAAIIAATAYLTDCEARRDRGEVIPDFVASVLADPKRGTKWFRVSPNLAAALIRTRDAEAARRTAAAARTANQPRIEEALAWVAAHRDGNDFAGSLAAGIARYGGLTDRQYEAAIRIVDRDARPAGEPAHERITRDGWYKVGDVIYKVQKAVHGSGNLYAKRLDVPVPGVARGEWVYEPGMVNRLTDEQRLTPEQAAEFGRLYGVCGVCGRTLTDEDSIDAGIGPVCITKLGAWRL